MQTDISKLFEFAESCVCDASHDSGHIRRVLKNALGIARNYPEADVRLLTAACILHDCGRREQLETGIPHSRAGAEKARAFLLENGCGAAFADGVYACIDAHSSHDLARAAGIEARILYDADKLEMTGAVGVSRALIYALEENEPLYAKDGESFWAQILTDMRFAGDTLLTPEARGTALTRTNLMRAFAESLKNECEGSCEKGEDDV